jgi:ABC-type multidrug transport system fused ATPase/permease subunit
MDDQSSKGIKPANRIKTVWRRAFQPLSYIWNLYDLTRRYRRHLIGLGLLSVAVTGQSGIMPQITRRIIDDAYPARDLDLFLILAIFMVGLNLVSAVLESVASYLSTYANNLIAYRVRMKVFHALHRVPVSYVESHQSGMFLERIASDAEQTARMLSSLIPQVISLVLTMIITVFFMLEISPLITVLVMIGIPLYYVISTILALKLREWQRRMRLKDEQLTTRAVEAIQGVPTARLFGVGKWLKKMYTNLMRDKIKLAFGMWRTQLIYGRMSWAASYGWGVAITLGVWYFVMKDRLTLGDAVALGMYIPILLRPAEQALGLYQALISSSVPAQRITEVLDKARELKSDDMRVELEIAKGIEMFKTTFAYPSGWSLKSISMHIECGKTAVIIGPTGSGKTTLLRLLAGMYDRYTGDILVDGIPLSRIKLSAYQANVAMVMPDNFFFSGTINENMLIARPNVTKEEVQETARILGIDRWLGALPNGYDTAIGVEGVRLSSGQIQKLAILRALLKKPSLLLLDEVTSAMDVESERHILDGINALRPPNCMTIMTTHRLTLTMGPEVDYVIVLGEGFIAEQGDPRELFAKGGEYARLMNLAGLKELV